MDKAYLLSPPPETQYWLFGDTWYMTVGPAYRRMVCPSSARHIWIFWQLSIDSTSRLSDSTCAPLTVWSWPCHEFSKG